MAVIGAGTRGEFREEDQLACAWIAAGLVEAGYRPRRPHRRARRALAGRAGRRGRPSARSADYLRRSGQLDDLDFILDHVDDLDATFELNGRGLVMVPAGGRPA